MSSASSSAAPGSLEEATERYLGELRRGEDPSIESYARQYADHAEEITRFFPTIRALEGAAVEVPGAPDPELVSPGASIGEYRIVREIGRGGMGVVLLAEQETMERRVALKLLPPRTSLDPSFLERFRREARAAGLLQHPHIVPVFGIGEQRGLHYYAMQFIEGEGLDRILRGLRAERDAGGEAPRRLCGAESTSAAGESVPDDQGADREAFFRDVARIGVQVADGLAHAHSHGVLHRDIKPGNLIVDTGGSAWITDFGLCRIGEKGDLSGSHDLLGTLRYMAPEQIEGRADVRSDVYGLGVTLYELITLRPAFRAQSRAHLLQSVLRGSHQRPRRIESDVPPDLEAITLKAMANLPEERYGTATALADDLRAFLEHRPVLARIPGVLHLMRLAARRNRALTATVLGALVLVAGLSVFYVGGLRRARAEEARQGSLANIAAAAAALRTDDTPAARRRLEAVPGAHRGWEWRHLSSRLDESLRTLANRSTPIEAVAWSATATPLLLARSGQDTPSGSLAWTNQPKPGSRQFFLAAGQAYAAGHAGSRRVLLNAIFWALGKEVPASGVGQDGSGRIRLRADARPDPPQRQRPWGAIVLSQDVSGNWKQSSPGHSPSRRLMAQPGRGDIVSRRDFDDYRLQLDFRIPASTRDTHTIWRGNSGVVVGEGYEIQIVEPEEGPSTTTSCGAINGVRPPDQAACLSSGDWQHLEARLLAARFENGVRVANARVTVFLNGLRIHDNLELPPARLPASSTGPARDGLSLHPIRLQADSAPVEFANIWVEPFDDTDRRSFLKPAPALTGNRWEDMDYGPFLTTSIEAPEPAGNIAYKGIAVPLNKGWDGHRQESIVFDTDLLRYAFAWEGGFLDLRGVAFDGTHNTHPLMKGTQLFSSPLAPGWSSDGEFEDPRSMKWEPLPREMAHYQGLSLYKNRVVFDYRVGESQILDMPGLQTGADGERAFTRDLEMHGNAQDLTVQVASGRGTSARFLHLEELVPLSGSDPANRTIAVIDNGRDVLATAVIGAPAGARWRVQGSHIRLQLPASQSTSRLRILMWNGEPADIGALSQLVSDATPLQSLHNLTQGGPSRWPDRLITKGTIGPSDGPFAVDRIAWPDPNPWRSWIRFGSFDFFRDPSRAALSTWNGDVWLVSGIDDDLDRLEWQRIATGLYQPLGLKVVDEEIYVLARDQITILRDLNGDGEADYYENFINDLQNTEHFHEFAMDLQTDAQGTSIS